MRSHGFEDEIDELGEQRLEQVLRVALEGLGLRLAETDPVAPPRAPARLEQ
jgi:hypothetical protein